jgi:hypothetical protein
MADKSDRRWILQSHANPEDNPATIWFARSWPMETILAFRRSAYIRVPDRYPLCRSALTKLSSGVHASWPCRLNRLNRMSRSSLCGSLLASNVVECT